MFAIFIATECNEKAALPMNVTRPPNVPESMNTLASRALKTIALLRRARISACDFFCKKKKKKKN